MSTIDHDAAQAVIIEALNASTAANAVAVRQSLEDGSLGVYANLPLTQRMRTGYPDDTERTEAIRMILRDALEDAIAHVTADTLSEPHDNSSDLARYRELLADLEVDGVRALFGLGQFLDEAAWQTADRETVAADDAWADAQTFPAGDGDDRMILTLLDNGLTYVLNDLLYPFGLGIGMSRDKHNRPYVAIVQAADPAGFEWDGEHEHEIGLGKIRDRALSTLRPRLIELETRITRELGMRTGFLADATHPAIAESVHDFMMNPAAQHLATHDRDLIDGGPSFPFDVVSMQVGITRSQLAAALQRLMIEGRVSKTEHGYRAHEAD